MAPKQPYSINLLPKFTPLDLIDIQALARACQEPWFNQTLCRVNDCVVRLGVLHGEFHWHSHEREDEFFYVVAGNLLIDLADHTIELRSQQGLVVPKGTRHRTRAPERTIVLMIEGAGVVPTGD